MINFTFLFIYLYLCASLQTGVHLSFALKCACAFTNIALRALDTHVSKIKLVLQISQAFMSTLHRVELVVSLILLLS
jgi:hypothetical protein